MGMTFAELEREYEKLWRDYEDGTLHSEDFSKALAGMRVEDAEGHWWQIKWNGKWMRYDGHQWVEATPPKAAPPPPPPEALIPPPRAPQPNPRPEAPLEFHEEDFSIFNRTGVPADQIPGLFDARPAPAAFLLNLKDQPGRSGATPMPLAVQARPLEHKPSRPEAGATPAQEPPVKSAPPESPVKVAPAKVIPASEVAPVVEPAPAAMGSGDCPKCHKRLVAGAQFCRYCGTTVGAAATPVKVEPVSLPKAPPGGACANCQHSLPAGAKFCGHCGHVVQVAPRSCPKCHTALAASAKFCPGCGQGV